MKNTKPLIKVSEEAGVVAADVFGLGVSSRWRLSDLFFESLKGLRQKILPGPFADLMRTHTSHREAYWEQSSPGHLAQINDEIISLSDEAAEGIGELKPFYNLGVLLGDLIVEVQKVNFTDPKKSAVAKLLHELPVEIRAKPSLNLSKAILRRTKKLSHFVSSNRKFKELWQRVRPDLQVSCPIWFLERMIENLHWHVRRVSIERSTFESNEQQFRLWCYNTYKRATMPELMALMGPECEQNGWEPVSQSTALKWIRQLEATLGKIKKSPGRPKKPQNNRTHFLQVFSECCRKL